jgi:predicted GTPase
MPTRIVIAGAAGRDFHNFNTVYRGRTDARVVAFTATQIPNIDGRVYPSVLAGPGYPDGIPIVPEDDLERIVADHEVDLVIFAYSDVTYEHVMRVGSRAMAAGADFALLGPRATMLRSTRPVVSVCAMRTGAGKSQTSRYLARILGDHGLRTAVIRHPMPYGDLARQAVQRFETIDDLDLHRTTIEEREEYEPHIREGRIVFAGVDYEAILRRAETEADVIIWDGGNNDLPFYVPDRHIVVLDPLRPDDIGRYYPSEANVRMADIFVVNKVDSATDGQIERVRREAGSRNAHAPFVLAASPPTPDDPDAIAGRRVLVVEDGPTLTHGGMAFGAGTVAAERYGASEIVDPRPYAVGSIRETYRKYPTTGKVLPAMGYGEEQTAELEETIRNVPADVVVIATPIDLRHVVRIDKPTVRVRYDLEVRGSPGLAALLEPWIADWTSRSGREG